LLDEPSALVRGSAIWALGQLMEVDAFTALQAQYLPQETDPDCQAEWQRPR
jgi:epoxyqueuosine reductase